MFEDFTTASAVDGDRATDRELLHGIWAHLESGDRSAVDGWAALSERYPDDLRFLLLLSFEQWQSASPLPADAFFRQAERLATDARLREPVTDLVSLARSGLRDALTGETGRAFERLAARFDGARRDEGEARGRLTRLERRVLEECHDRTLGNRPLAPKRKPAEMRTGDWPVLVEKTRNEPALPYSTKTRFKEGAKVEHPTLGVGFVVGRREGKIDVLFQSGKRTLVGK